MKKILVIVIGLSLILPISIGAWTAVDCDEYCDEVNKGNKNVELPVDQVCVCNPFGDIEFEGIVDGLISFIFNIAIVLYPVMVVVAGIMFVIAGGSLEQIAKAKRIIIWSSVGFIIVMLAKGLQVMLEKIIGVK